MPTGAQLFVETLLEASIRELFTLVGDHLNEVLSRAHAAGIRIIDMRHESGVTHAADVLARQRRGPAVSLVTGGPGHTNSLTGIATAYLAGSPLVAVSGAAPAAGAGRQLFQVIDQVGMAAPVVKWAAQAGSPAQVPYLLGRAFAEAVSGRMGPVHLSIPADVFEGATDRPLPAPRLPSPPWLAPSAGEAEQTLDILQAPSAPSSSPAAASGGRTPAPSFAGSFPSPACRTTLWPSAAAPSPTSSATRWATPTRP